MKKDKKFANGTRGSLLNKKAFTLIELLAIIVILAIIAVITVPIILNVIDNSKKGSIQDSVYGYKDAVNKYYVSELYENPDLKLEGTYTIDENGKLSDGTNIYEIPFSGTIPTGGNLTYENNILKDGCITMDEYKVTIENGEVKTTEKGSCGEALTPVAYKCKRATELHKEECERDHSTYYCSGAGYAGKTIEYGNLGTKGAEPVGGDAFDCAVKDTNGNSIIDDNDMTERFYYVSDLYDPTIEGDDKFNHEVAVLIYYSNTANESASETSPIAYDSTHGNYVDENWHGPLTAKTYLPRTIGWTNMSLTNTNRQILNENGEAKSNNGVNSLPTFSYEEYATRLLTTQELESGCGIDNGIGKNGELENCNYLLENTIYTSNQSDTGYWLENPAASTSYGVWFVNGSGRLVSYNSVSFSANGAYGVRPVIEVLKTDIDF